MPSIVTLTAKPLGQGKTVVSAISAFTGKENTIVLPIDIFTFSLAVADWRAGRKMIQHAFPELDDAQREFLLTGTTQEEWDAAFPPEDEEDGQDHEH